MKIRAILDGKYYEDIPTLKAYVGVLDSLQHVSRAIAALNELMPVPDFQHLKRVKRSEGKKAFILLCAAPDGGELPAKRAKLEEEPALSRLRGKGFEPSDYGMSGVEIHDVPAAAPATRLQYEKSNKLWPVYFYPDKKLEGLMKESIFDDSEEAYHLSNMKWVMGESGKTGKNVALVVDFDNRQRLAKGIERLELHPLQHAVMVAIDAVAGVHRGGGAWDLPMEELAFVSELLPKRVEDRDLSPDEEAIGPYLCTGYDIYVDREPCVMCAMSLVHSRIKRVFFRVRNFKRGALASKCQIHSIRDLNHHYGVFQISD